MPIEARGVVEDEIIAEPSTWIRTGSTAHRCVVHEEEAADQLVGRIDAIDQEDPDIASNGVVLRRSSPNELDIEHRSRQSLTRRSLESRKRRNQHRNRIRRVLRDRHLMIRDVYHRFTVKQVKQQLKHLQIKNVHLRLDKLNRCLYIGLEKPERIDQYFDLIPGDLFDRRHYQQFYARRPE